MSITGFVKGTLTRTRMRRETRRAIDHLKNSPELARDVGLHIEKGPKFPENWRTRW